MNMSKIGNILKHIFVTQTKGIIDVSQKKELWLQFAQQNNGIFKVINTVSYDLASFNLKMPIQNGSIEFSESDTHPLKMICEIRSKERIEFSIIKKDFISKIFNFFTPQRILLNPELDKKYKVKNRSRDIAIDLLKNESIIPLIFKTDIYSIICQYSNKEEKITITGMGYASSLSQMQDIYSLFKVIILQI